MILLVAGVGIVLLFCSTYASKAIVFQWMLACTMVGIFTGFLFGIPKVLQSGKQWRPENTYSKNEDNDGNGESLPKEPKLDYQQQVNTNLTEISDWLTKIIIGLGLVNLTKIHPHLLAISKLIGSGLRPGQGSSDELAVGFAYGIIVGYVILGFLFGYINTRIYLAGLFSQADLSALYNISRRTNEAAGAAESAIQKVNYALASRGISEAVTNNSRIEYEGSDQLEELIQDYYEIRSNMPRGVVRTQKMAEVLSQMVQAAKTTSKFDVSSALRDKNPGKRLAAYAWLISKPDPTQVGDLIKTLVAEEPTRFGQYWAIQALARNLGARGAADINPEYLKKLRDFYEKLEPGVDRKYELSKIFPEFKN